MTRWHGPERPPDKRIGPEPGRDQAGAESREAGNLSSDHSTVIHFPRERWHVPFALARRIGRLPPPLKPAAVRCWRVSVQAALGQEVRL